MNLLTEEQLQQIETVFGLQRLAETAPVKDGLIKRGAMVWWCGESGPEYINSEKEWTNIKEYPNVYCINKPKYTITYKD